MRIFLGSMESAVKEQIRILEAGRDWDAKRYGYCPKCGEPDGKEHSGEKHKCHNLILEIIEKELRIKTAP